MSLQSLVETYINEYNAKGNNPNWLADLRRTINSRNISVNDWNMAMDNIRKVASDNIAVRKFIEGFEDEFSTYYERAIKSIQYITDTENYVAPDSLAKIPYDLTLKSKAVLDRVISDPSKFKNTMEYLKASPESEEVLYMAGEDLSEDVGFMFNFNESTYISNIIVYLHSVAHPVEIYFDVGRIQEDGTLSWVQSDILYLKPFTTNTPYARVAYINQDAVDCIKIYQKANTGYTNGRFGIKAIDIIKSNVTGYYDIEDYLGSSFKIPMVNPEDFESQMSKHVVDAGEFAQSAILAASTASTKVNAILDAEDQANGFVRLDSNRQVPMWAIPNLAMITRHAIFIGIDFDIDVVESIEKYINDRLVLQARTGIVQEGDHLDVIDTKDIPSIDDPTKLIKQQVIQRSYVFCPYTDVTGDEDYDTLLNYWKLIGTDYSTYAARAGTADHAYSSDRVQGVLVRFGTNDEFEASDKQGVYIVSEYTSEELKNG